MFLQERHTILAILDDLAGNLQRQVSTSNGHHLYGLVSLRQQRRHADFSDRGNRADSRLNLQFEVVLKQPAQLTSHFESKGVHPHVGDLAFTQEWFHLLLENIPLPEQAFDGMLGLIEFSYEDFGQRRADFVVTLL